MKIMTYFGLIYGIVLSPMYLFTNINFTIASLAYLLLCTGLYFKSNRTIHIRCMVSGIFLDIALVLYLQVTRSAVQVAVSGEENLLQMIHITCSTIAVLLYFPSLYLGFKTMKDASFKTRHKKIALLAFLFRSLGFLFMFSQLNKN